MMHKCFPHAALPICSPKDFPTIGGKNVISQRCDTVPLYHLFTDVVHRNKMYRCQFSSAWNMSFSVTVISQDKVNI